MEGYIKKQELENVITKVNNFIKIEELCEESLKILFKNFTYLYKTKNTSKLETITNEFLKKEKIIDKNLKSNVMVLKKNIDKYVQTEAEVATLFNDIKND